MSRPLSILHAPTYGPTFDLGAIRFACSVDADSIGFTEAYRMTAALRRRIGYRCRVGKSLVDTRAINSPRGDAGDVPILVRRRLPLIEWHAERVTPPGFPQKFAPERWITEVVYEHAIGDVEHINAHPDPAFVDGHLWERYMDRLVSRITRAADRGRHVIVTGDLQSGRAARYLDRANLDYWRVGIDYIAHSPHLRIVERSPLVDRSQVGQESPHPWLLARFVCSP